MPVDYDAARELLDEEFGNLEAAMLQGQDPAPPGETREAFKIIFGSNTQAYREVLVGCTIARLQDRDINIRLPYVNQGADAFNGRTLDERVVNPFFQANRIPSSRGPYLGVFRRSVQFDENTRGGVRDKVGYDALMDLISFLEGTDDEDELLAFLRYLLYGFAKIREAATVPLSRLHRISLEQYDVFISGLLGIPSGGRIPVILVVSTFQTIKEFYGLNWNIDFQGINVADAAAGAGGDITITRGEAVLLAAEVTERPIDRNRVVATFNTKIAPNAIDDYLFFIRLEGLEEEARIQARQYFTQGHEVNFLEIKDWILMSLATMGKQGRDIFNRTLTAMIDAPEIPRTVKVGWNGQIARLVGG